MLLPSCLTPEHYAICRCNCSILYLLRLPAKQISAKEGEQKPWTSRPQGAHCGLCALCAIKISDKLSATVNKKPQNWNILILFTANVLLGRESWTAEYYGWRGLPGSLMLITNARAKLRISQVAGAAVHLHCLEISTTSPIPQLA